MTGSRGPASGPVTSGSMPGGAIVASRRWPLVILAGVAAGVHIWKVPPFVAEISERFGTSLVDAGFLMGVLQLAGVVGGLAVGFFAEYLGFRRCMLAGLAVLSVASIGGAFAAEFWMLLVLRGVESVGFLLAIVAGPGVIRSIAPPAQRSLASGAWGSYMGLAAFGTLTVTALLAGLATKEGTWIVAGALTAVVAVAVLLWVPADRPRSTRSDVSIRDSLSRTVRARGVWVCGLVFMFYAATWMAVLGFLPTILGDAGADPGLANLLSGIASGANVLGNVSAAVLLQRGASARLLLSIGAAVMAVSSFCIFALELPTGGQFAAVLVFSAVAGLIPGTLFPLVLGVMPTGGSSTTAVGILMQCTNAGLFFGPPVLAALTTATGNWSSSWWFTVALAAMALLLAQFLGVKRYGYRLGGAN
ncbi:MFS transporter [Pseudoclavibacter endophyticus]|uniref:MFS transporter n=1 Tax=Pseudoclavibacter endophyticus TaxID=1778590 RepID=A0A6H9WTL5_9MICO|nr:MFS transporter [Pseudoclavibacter endophyticus]KAB1649754.1 MFS transporter [Pseudoclavibacter endophyticus]GGA60009.1 MFS transporter [Pseudoclavibacter endophyticus]